MDSARSGWCDRSINMLPSMANRFETMQHQFCHHLSAVLFFVAFIEIEGNALS